MANHSAAPPTRKVLSFFNDAWGRRSEIGRSLLVVDIIALILIAPGCGTDHGGIYSPRPLAGLLEEGGFRLRFGVVGHYLGNNLIEVAGSHKQYQVARS
jgi:hypothetical protein